MATYKSEAGAILQPGNQINRLSSYNTMPRFLTWLPPKQATRASI
jgi:hypothetical protein